MVQAYLLSLWRPQALRFLKFGIAITKKRQDANSSTAISTESTAFATYSFFAFLVTCEDATDHILSFLDLVAYGRKQG